MVAFGFSGMVISSDLGGPIVGLILLVFSASIALLVLMMDSAQGYPLRSIVGVVLFCALGFAIGWVPFHYARRAIIPAGQFLAGPR